MYTSRKNGTRAGVSFVEFVGCIIALGGGLALGSMYLGVDMKSLAANILEQADIQPSLLGLSIEDKTPTAEEPARLEQSPATALQEPSANEQPRDETSAGVNGTVAKSEVDDLTVVDNHVDSKSNHTTVVGDAERVDDTHAEMTEEERQRATKSYWNGLTQCIRAEASGRYSGINSPSEWQLFDYLTHRKKGHDRAVEVLKELDLRGVDKRLVAHGKQVLAWQSAGAQLFGRAVHLLTDGPSAELTGPFAQSWQSAATQHRMEETLVRNKHIAVASYLDHEYESLAPFEPAAAR